MSPPPPPQVPVTPTVGGTVGDLFAGLTLTKSFDATATADDDAAAAAPLQQQRQPQGFAGEQQQQQQQQTPVASNRRSTDGVVDVRALPAVPSLRAVAVPAKPPPGSRDAEDPEPRLDALLGTTTTTTTSGAPPASSDDRPPSALPAPPKLAPKKIPAKTNGSSGGSYFGGWFGSSSSSAEKIAPTDADADATTLPDEADAFDTPPSDAAPNVESPVESALVPPIAAPQSSSVELTDENGNARSSVDTKSAAAQQADDSGGDETLPARQKMPAAERQQLDEAFLAGGSAPAKAATATTTTTRASSGGGGGGAAEVLPPLPTPAGRLTVVTTVPSAAVCLTLLRHFAHKTRPRILQQYGGSQSRSMLQYLLSSSSSRSRHPQQESTFAAYRTLLDCVFAEGEDRDDVHHSHGDDGGGSVERPDEKAIDGSGRSTAEDTPAVQARAAAAVAAFVDVFAVWGHASSALSERPDQAALAAVFAPLLVAILDAASQLAAHGCLDGVDLAVAASGNAPPERHGAASLLASSVFNADLSLPRVELAAVKFLLDAGCRHDPSVLRGSYLLQSIRTLYHVYLTTEARSNKVAARGALQQLVTSVFTKVVATTAAGIPNPDEDDEEEGKLPPHHHDVFPTDNHRDAFLVLRSICKLSMRNLPDESSGLHSHVGLHASASSDTWDGDRLQSASERGGGGVLVSSSSEHSSSSSTVRPQAHLIYTGAMHPALESKLLALDLLLYVLQNTDFTGFIQHCGPQFHVAVRNYLCVSLLKNCTSDNTRVVSLSLRIFVPVVRNFRTVLKTEIEAFVTNVFFVILDSKNSPAEHKSIVVNTFNEICSDPSTLAEIFLNYDCDLSAVDLFHRIVNTLSRLSRSGLQEPMRSSGMSFMGGGPSEAQMEKHRSESRALRLDAMRALRQILASLHASIVEPMGQQVSDRAAMDGGGDETDPHRGNGASTPATALSPPSSPSRQTLVEIYGSKKKRRAEESEAVLRFNQKPSAGMAYAAKCKHIDPEDPTDVARYLLKNKDEFDKAMIGEYLGREVEYQNGFSIRVLHEYVRLLDLTGLVFDDAIRFFLSGFRLPGEAQKIDRIMEKFAERFTEQNPTVFPTADAAFILSFSIIMLNTDLHNAAIKEDRRMTKEGFVRNNRGICDGQDLPEELLNGIFDRIKQNPISLKEDDEARERAGDSKKSSVGGLPAALNPASFFSSHYNDMDRARETNFQKERDHIVRTTESLLKRRRHGVEPKSSPVRSRSFKSHRHASRFVLSCDSGLRDEYVSPMFEVTWGPGLAAFSTAMESANGTVGALISIASDEELELAAENAAETIEVCLTGFRFAIGIAGLCGNSIARDAYMLALSRFSQIGTGVLLEPRHIRCVQTMFSLAREDGELLGDAWEHVFKSLSEVNRFHQVFQLMARNDRAAAQAADRRRRRLEAMETKRQAREQRKAAAEDGESIGDANDYAESESEDDDDSLAESGLFTDDDFDFDANMDAKAIDEANAREVYDAVSEATIEAIYERSSSLSATAVTEFVVQLCLVSRAEISVGTNNLSGDLNQVNYRQKHALLNSNAHAAGDQFHHTQPNIYNLQKLVEVTHYNMASRPRLLFADIWVTVADHLTNTALHSNPAIAMYAVDSFRQLCIQYLQRDELEVFEFQRRFLKPLETVMALSQQTSTKELLLNCVARLMHVFGNTAVSGNATSSRHQGGLRSGWVPILTILGTGGRDDDEGIAQMSFKALSGEINLCLRDNKHPDVLLTDHFVETVNAMLMMVGGPHDGISVLAIEQLVILTDSLGDGSIPTSQVKRKAAPNSALDVPKKEDPKRQLELWWPVLLGLSRAVGDSRYDVRSKSLDALFVIINKHFYPADLADETPIAWETVQLIFRGVLSSVLEFAETASNDEPPPGLPDDFERILTNPRKNQDHREEANSSSWLETTFEPFMDACVAVCLRSMAVSKDSVLIEELFAIFNSCLLSDSGALAVRGLRRLEQFVTSDLDTSSLTDDVWATVSHMLQRCLTVRGLPKKDTKAVGLSEDEAKERDAEYAEAVNEFIAEDSFLVHRRYIGSNATMVVGLLLCNDRFSIGLRWRLFLVKWLHRGIREWDSAGTIISSTQDPKMQGLLIRHPDYRETALYGRKWINRLVLQLAAMSEVAEAPAIADPKTNRFLQGQKQVIEWTEGMLMSFVQKEEAALLYRRTEMDELIYKRYTGLVQELLAGYGNMDDEHLQQMHWISPVLLSSCIRSKNEDVRIMVQKLVSRTSPAPHPVAPYPSPAKPSEAIETEAVATEESLSHGRVDVEGSNGIVSNLGDS